MKLIGNLLVAAQMPSLGEALTLARKAGLDGGAVMGVLDVTDYSSPPIRGVGRATLAGNYEPSFFLRHMLKDARLISDFARNLEVPLPASAPLAPSSSPQSSHRGRLPLRPHPARPTRPTRLRQRPRSRRR
jgi:3-hydroxyisobutyrate dehydrogenase-like beta-hydroxyacid dehydrogenase